VDDGEAAGSSGGARGGLDQWRLLQGFRGSDLAIGLAPATIEVANGARRSGEGWGVRWCAQLLPGNALFIGLSKGCGAVARSTMARLLRRLVELGVVMAMLYVSRRGERWRRLGRGGPGWVALLPRRPRRLREQVVVSGAGGHGSGLGACLAASRCHCGAQRVHRGSRASGRRWNGAWPVAAMRDAVGIQG
jgi:hypothetical protein